MRLAVAIAAVVGGLCWIVAAWVGVLFWVGAVLLTVAVLAAGAALVSRTATWLRAVVAVCFLALVASVLGVLRDNVDHAVLLVAAGLVAVAVGAPAVVRTRRAEGEAGGSRRPERGQRAQRGPRAPGAHAA
ncbi:hypothetical protein [Nocardioides sp.]|uniref:hypothetical protein n=1 Tax=Nocardioides sp. TaxID=35761 RepID=UPI0037830928